MPTWKQPYKVRRATNILSFAVRQLNSALEHHGEACFLLKRFSRANSPTTVRSDRRVATITKAASAYTTDPDTGALRAKIWSRNSDPLDEYPDIGVFTATVQATGGTSIWESAVDKYSFISAREEYAFDIFQDEIDSNNDDIEDAVYVVFNTGPFTATNSVVFTFGTINPLVKFEGMQPIRDTETGFQKSIFGFDQWTSSTARIRRRVAPNRFLLAFPTLNSDIRITDGGFLQDSRVAHWTNTPPYSPVVQEFDVIVRESTGERYQVIDYVEVRVEDILVQQQFSLVELDPRSSIYQITIETT
jgi:hypothetical protein